MTQFIAHAAHQVRWAIQVVFLARLAAPQRLVLLALMASLWAPLVMARTLDQMEHRRWTAADDGPGQVGALAQTRDGYLWLGSNESLLRFDGVRFSPYLPADGDELGIVSALLATDTGLWVGLRKGGARLIRADGMDAYAPQPGLPGGVVYGFAEDQQGAIWLAAGDGLARFDGQHWQQLSTRWGFPVGQASAVFVARDGVVWAASENKLLYLPKGSQRFVDSGISAPSTSAIAEAEDGTIWLAHRYDGVLQRYDPRNGELLRLPTGSDGVSGLLFDHRGALWIATVGGGIRHLPRAVASQLAGEPDLAGFGVRDGLSSGFIWPLLEDTEGNVWVGTSAGLDRFRPRAATPVPLPRHATNFALAADADGSLWAGTANTYAVRLSSSGLHPLDMPPPVNAAMTDMQGRVWMAGPTGIWRAHDGQLKKATALPIKVPPDSSVRAMVLDEQGDLWVSINRAGLFVWRDGKWLETPPASLQPNQTMPVSAANNGADRLWFGYRDNLLISREGSGTRHWGENDGLQIGHVTAISMQGSRGWVGGQRGVAYFDGSRFHSLQLPSNGLFDNIYAIIPVPSTNRSGPGNDLWVQGKYGIFVLPAAEIEHAMADPAHIIRYRTYDMAGGLANAPHQILPLPTAVRGPEGDLWFATSHGVIRIDPHPRPQLAVPPKVAIESVTVDGREISSPKPRLNADAKRISITYAALSLSGPEAMHFRYRLEGFDDDWHHAGAQRQAIFTGLGAGNYRFSVVALNRDGMSSTEAATLSFSVAPVFYLRPPFLLGGALLLIALLWSLYRASLRRSASQLRARLEERHAERERIARELHDTLLQGVQGLILRFQAVAQTIPDDMPARSRMEQALDRADQVLADSRDRVLDLRTAGAPPTDLVTALLSANREREQHAGARLIASIQGEQRPLQPIVREELYRIGLEAITNAMQHSHGERVTLYVIFLSEVLELRVTDDGVGIEPAYLAQGGRPGHWGLPGMRERAQRIGGRLSVRAIQPRGTEIRIVLPAACAYRRSPGRVERLWRRFKSTRRKACKRINPSE